jgi:hypothetical protein
MAFAVDDYRALVQLLLEPPEWRAELRPLILGEEIESLPVAVGALRDTTVDLTTEVRELARQVERVTAAVDRLGGRVGRLEGNDLEARYHHHVDAWFGKWLRRPRAVGPSDLDLVDAAIERGELSEDDEDQLRLADLLVKGNRKSQGAAAALSGELVIVAEISLTIDEHDVERANSRADIVRRAGYSARGFVGGEAVTAAAMLRAGELDVIVDLHAP